MHRYKEIKENYKMLGKTSRNKASKPVKICKRQDNKQKIKQVKTSKIRQKTYNQQLSRRLLIT